VEAKQQRGVCASGIALRKNAAGLRIADGATLLSLSILGGALQTM
jgi:hypothetical protein